MLQQDESLVFEQDDPAALGLLVGNIEGAMMEANELSAETEALIEKYDINTIDVDKYINGL